MNHLLATVITGLVKEENSQFYLVQKEGLSFALAKEEGSHRLGDMVKGFVYTDMKQRLRLTTKPIDARRDHYGWGEVTTVRRDLGVFVDTGIPDKEIVVSLDVLPELKDLWPKKGDRLYLKLVVDKKIVSGVCQLSQRYFKGLLVQPMITCKIKACLLLSIA